MAWFVKATGSEIKELLSLGAEVDAVNKDNETALQAASAVPPPPLLDPP